jgi:hypothetical protein
VTNRSGAVRADEAEDRLGEGADEVGDAASAGAPPDEGVRSVADGEALLLSEGALLLSDGKDQVPTDEAGDGAVAAGLPDVGPHPLNGSSTTMAAPTRCGPHPLRTVINLTLNTSSDVMRARTRLQRSKGRIKDCLMVRLRGDARIV